MYRGKKAWFHVDITANGKNLKNVKEVFNRKSEELLIFKTFLSTCKRLGLQLICTKCILFW